MSFWNYLRQSKIGWGNQMRFYDIRLKNGGLTCSLGKKISTINFGTLLRRDIDTYGTGECREGSLGKKIPGPFWVNFSLGKRISR